MTLLNMMIQHFGGVKATLHLIRGGHVKVNGVIQTDPDHEVKMNDIITVGSRKRIVIK